METKQQKSRFHSMQSKSFIAALVVAALVFFVSGNIAKTFFHS
jgi:uncharacterized membrane protein